MSVPLRAHSLKRACALLALLWTAAAHAQAAPADADSREQRRSALYKEGVVLADSGRWAEAVEKFREVVALRSAPPALFTLGQAEEKLGRLATAERTYERALTDARAQGNTQVADASIKAITTLTPKVPRLILRLAHGKADPGSVTALVDDSPVAVDTPIKLDPGHYRVLARAPGMHGFTARAWLGVGTTTEVRVSFTSEQAPAPAATVVEPARPSRPFPVGPVLVASAGLGLGIVGLVVRQGGWSDYDATIASCPGSRCLTQALVDDANGARNRVITGTALVGVGAVALAGAGLWWALGSSRAPASARLRIVPDSYATGAALQGRF